MTLTTIGNPRPPFLMIAPNGAPMKKKSRHAMLSENFSCKTCWCFLRLVSSFCMSLMFISMLSQMFLVEEHAELMMDFCSLSVKLFKRGHSKMVAVSVVECRFVSSLIFLDEKC